MGMSKKDFVDIATDLHIERNSLTRDPVDADELRGFDRAVDTLLGPFKRANSNFEQDFFMKWVEDGVQKRTRSGYGRR